MPSNSQWNPKFKIVRLPRLLFGVCAWFSNQPLFWALPVQSILFFWRLDLLAPWGDELFTLDVAPQSLRQIGSIVADNIHPPLYFDLLHFWIQLPWPGTLIEKMRAMSALWGLAATALFYFLWLRKEDRITERTILLLWIFSPCLLLYARMARSYTMQLTIALVTIHAALAWMEQLGNRRRLFWYSVCAALLLYTHYLPGLAIVAAVSIRLLLLRGNSWNTRITAALGSSMIVTIFYLPWLAVMRSAVTNWISSGTYRVGGMFTDQIVRLGYWFVSFAFGETLSTTGVMIGAVMAPVIAYGLRRAVRVRPDWLHVVLIATAFAYLGVSRWSGFPFTPARVLFALPFFLMLCVRGIREGYQRSALIFTFLAALYVMGIYSYFSKVGYLNKGYCVPYSEMAETIRNGPSSANTWLVVDTYSSIAEPLLSQVPPGLKVILLDGNDSAEEVRRAAQNHGVIWFWRRTHDTSPNAFVSRLEGELSLGRHVSAHGFLPYSRLELWFLNWLRGSGQSAYFYQLAEIE